MSLAITVPKEYGYVIVTAVSTFFLGVWHGFRVITFRSAAGMKYPKAYADSGDISAAASPEKKMAMYIFNCAQRAHGNYLENHPSVVASMLIAGLQHPLVTAGLGVAWSVFRVIYAVGYTRRDKENGSGRMAGGGFWLAQLGLFGLAAWTGIQMLI